MRKIVGLLFLIFQLAVIPQGLATESARQIFSRHWSTGSRDAFTGPRKWIWAAGGLATILAFNSDKAIYNQSIQSEGSKFANDVSDLMGTGILGVVLGVSTYTWGSYSQQESYRESGTSQLEGILATSLYTLLLKGATDRPRPEKFDPDGHTPRWSSSFPSGHSSTAFASAAGVAAQHGWAAGAPLFALAGLTGYSRVQKGAHYLSDVLFGATLGTAMGYGYAVHHLTSEAKIVSQIIPVIDSENGSGVLFVTEWP